MAAVRKDNAFQAKGRRTAEEGQAMEEQKKMGKKRMANVELLRICSMLMIVLMHLLNHGKVLETVEKGSVSYYLTWTIFGISFVSISCYILISGYFCVKLRSLLCVFFVWRGRSGFILWLFL